VPLVYGNSIVELKFFGPWGEERTRQQNINIPFNFLPEKTMEYTASAGIVEDSLMSRFSRVSINYGVFRSLTLGGGVEYLSSVKSGPAMPFINGSFSLLKNILLSGEYTYGVRAKGTLTYRFPSNLQFDLNYTKYDKNQTAINYNYLEERKAVVSIPLKIGRFSSYQRFTLNQIVLPVTNYTTGEWMFSGSLLGVSTNLSTNALFIGSNKPSIYSNISFAFRLPAGIVMRPQAQYGYTQNKLLLAKVSLEKHLLTHGFLNLSFEQNMVNNIQLAEMGFRYDFSFAQTGASVRQSDRKTTLVQYARGSLINDRSTRYLGTDNRPNVGKGGISIIPYLDLNANGVKDPGEPKVYGLNLHTNGGRVEKSERDTTIRILGLEPYTNCFIDLDPNSFENIAWKLPVKTLSVAVDPNMLKHIELPIMVAGEATGIVTLLKNGEKKGLGRIILGFYTGNLKPAGKTLTEDDGYFSYLGLAPGSYIVRIDTAQLRRLGMKSDPLSIKFDLAVKLNGDIADKLNFSLQMIAGDTLMPKTGEKPVTKKDTTVMIVHEVTQELVTISEDIFAIQLGAFRVKSNADALRSKLQRLLGRKVDIIIEDSFYKVRINDIKDRKEVDEIVALLQKNGITELWVISLKAKKQLLVTGEKQDTTIMITSPEEISIQLGAFRRKSNAIILKDRLSASISENVIIVSENGYYKVRVVGPPFIKQTVLEAMKKLEPKIGKLGIKDIWILPVKTPAVEKPVIIQPEAPLQPVEGKMGLPDIIKPDTSFKHIEKMSKAPVINREPKVSLQVGAFTKRSEALRAQRKITSKLKLPVEIVEQWEYYRVIITGFYTREETYKYYPELAGLGFTNISLIEKK
jgi:cell division protein FtsN